MLIRVMYTQPHTEVLFLLNFFFGAYHTLLTRIYFLFEGTIPPSPPQTEADCQGSQDNEASASNIRFHVTVEENDDDDGDDDGDDDVDMHAASGDGDGSDT